MRAISTRKLAWIGLYTALVAFAPFRLCGADTAGWDATKKTEFLSTAKIVNVSAATKGITGSRRVTLSDGETTHDAHVQTINERRSSFQPAIGPPELNFRDTYMFNIAAWKLAVLLGIGDMLEPSVERKFGGSSAAYTWWVDNFMMDEDERLKKKMTAPDQQAWNREQNVMLVFDQLIYNTDRNIGNSLIDKNWRLWLIDHGRAFRLTKTLRNPGVLSYCDRNLLAKMKGLDEPGLRKELEPYVGLLEIQGLLARRDLIVKFFGAQGERFLYDRPARK